MSEKSIKVAAISAVCSILITVFALDFYGMIHHPRPETGFKLTEFRLLPVTENAESRMSSKPSGVYAECIQGYLFFRTEKDAQYQGFIVDHLKRGVECGAPGHVR